MYTIGIDIGTTNTKGIALSDNGAVLYECSVPTKVRTVPTGGEIDPKELVSNLLNLLRELIGKVRAICGESLTAIGITGMAEAGCLVDLEGEPQTPILLWYDQRGGAEAEDFRNEYEDLLTSTSGIRMSNVATIYKLCYLKKHFPLVNGLVYRWFGVPEWVAWILTGKHYTDRTLAVRTGAYSLKTNDWSDELLQLTGLDRDLFPEIIPAKQQPVVVSEILADSLGISPDVRIVVAGHDDMAAAYGAGLSNEMWIDSTGTAEGLVALTNELPDPRQTVRSRMSIAPWYSEGAWALIAGIGTSGSLLSELHRQTGLRYDQIDEIAKQRANYPVDGLTTELTPQRLAIVTFAEGLTDAQKVSAVYDQIIGSFSQRAEQLMRFATKPEHLAITGGHALLPELCRCKSEVLGGILFVARPKPEAAAYGAAMLAF